MTGRTSRSSSVSWVTRKMDASGNGRIARSGLLRVLRREELEHRPHAVARHGEADRPDRPSGQADR